MASEVSVNPNPERWWQHRRWQSYLGYVGLAALGAGVFTLGVPDGAGDLLEYIALGFLVPVIGYAPGSTIVDAIRAWRS